MATGGCLCGNITYQTTGVMRPIVACHCSQCRKTSGHHVAATSVVKAEIHVEGDVTWYQSSTTARRGFCAVCGGNLFWEDQASDRISIMAGTLDHSAGLSISGHIFVDDKAEYMDLSETKLPTFGGADAQLTTK